MISYPFDSNITGTKPGGLPIYDRAVSSKVLQEMYSAFYTNGVIPIPNMGFTVTPDTGMNLKISAGKIFIDGVFAYETEERIIALEAANPSLDCIARVVMRKNSNVDQRNVDIYVVYGEPASQPKAPQLTRSGSVYEMALCDVFIAKGVTTIQPDRITDQRLNAELCGVCSGAVKEIDTTTIFNQLQGALDEYMQIVQNAINQTTAGNLQNQINNLDNKKADKTELGDQFIGELQGTTFTLTRKA